MITCTIERIVSTNKYVCGTDLEMGLAYVCLRSPKSAAIQPGDVVFLISGCMSSIDIRILCIRTQKTYKPSSTDITYLECGTIDSVIVNVT